MSPPYSSLFMHAINNHLFSKKHVFKCRVLFCFINIGYLINIGVLHIPNMAGLYLKTAGFVLIRFLIILNIYLLHYNYCFSAKGV